MLEGNKAYTQEIEVAFERDSSEGVTGATASKAAARYFFSLISASTSFSR